MWHLDHTTVEIRQDQIRCRGDGPRDLAARFRIVDGLPADKRTAGEMVIADAERRSAQAALEAAADEDFAVGAVEWSSGIVFALDLDPLPLAFAGVDDVCPS